MKSITNVLLASLLVSLSLACTPSNLGENGYITFSDETRGPGFKITLGVTKPVAKGAMLNVRVSEPDLDSNRVSVDQPEVLTISSVNQIQDSTQSQVSLSAKASGESKLEVALADGQTDRISITVEDVGSSEIALYPWDSLIPLDPALWAQGINALPNTNLTMFGHMKSVSGQALTGFNALDWHVDTGGDASIAPAAESDFAVFTSGTIPGDNTLLFGESEPLSIATIGANQVSRITLISPFQDPTIRTGASLILHAALFTEDGGYVVGIDDEAVVFETSENGTIGQLAQDADPDTAEALNLERAYRFGRATDFNAQSPGTYIVTARWKGIEAQISIDVVESAMQGEAPIYE
jgi:hypothetical protein